MITAPAASAPTRDLWHSRIGAPLVLLLLALPLAVAILWSGTTALDPAAASASIAETAAVVEATAASTTRMGERMLKAAEASTAADRDAWIAYGRHMIEDGRGLADLAARLRGTATVAAADPVHRSTDVAVAVLQARWESLRADGRATTEHGRVMVRMAGDLGPGVAAGILSQEDVAEVRSTAARMVESGERVVRTAELLLTDTSLAQRWMGVSR